MARPFKEVISELWGDVFAFDTRFLRTLGPLLFRPGFLTCEYLAGRRERYAEPIRAYVFASLVFFGVVALTQENVVRVYMDESDPAMQDTINSIVNAAVTYVHFFLVPVFAAIVMVFHRRSGRYYIEHFVFALHYGAFAFLGFLAFGAVGRALGGSPEGPQPPPVQALALVWGVGLLAYLVAALRRVYGGSWRASLLRAVAIGILYLAVFLLVSAALVVAAVLLVRGEGPFPAPRGAAS